jgi:hypothetical protein
MHLKVWCISGNTDAVEWINPKEEHNYVPTNWNFKMMAAAMHEAFYCD